MIPPTATVAAEIVDEFADARLGDTRRNQRLESIARRLVANPDSPFPRALATSADLEGFYRFLRNKAVTFETLLEPHVQATVERLSGLPEAIAVHDTTEFRYGGTRDELGRLGKAGHGFLAHLSIAVSRGEARAPLGTLAAETWVRTGPTATSLRRELGLSWKEVREIPTEQARWARVVDATEAAVGRATSLIHVMDSEADDYALMSTLVEKGRRWVIRLGYDRVVEASPLKAKALMAQSAIVCKREVPISPHRRQYGGGVRARGRVRDGRIAKLSISASPLRLKRPRPASPKTPATLDVNVVAVRELKPPPGADPVEWLLLTTEPIATEEQILSIIDAYRARWRIEEFFKALKTGCAPEKRHLESKRTLLNARALC